MTEVLYDLCAATGEEKYKLRARRFEHVRFLNPLAANRDNLTNIHANTNIPKIYGAVAKFTPLYQVTTQPSGIYFRVTD